MLWKGDEQVIHEEGTSCPYDTGQLRIKGRFAQCLSLCGAEDGTVALLSSGPRPPQFQGLPDILSLRVPAGCPETLFLIS